jgi:hypothetical protein
LKGGRISATSSGGGTGESSAGKTTTSITAPMRSRPTRNGSGKGDRKFDRQVSVSARSNLPDADDATIEAFDRLVQDGANDAERQMILRLAETTSSPRIRNAAAIAMADLRIEGARQLLVRLLARDDTKGHRGTLLYALEELGDKIPLPLLVTLLLEGNYETREQALDLLGKEQILFTSEELTAAIAALRALPSCEDEYSADVGKTAVRWLKSLKRKRK